MSKRSVGSYPGGSTHIGPQNAGWFSGRNDKKKSKYDRLDRAGYVPPRTPAEQREFDDFKRRSTAGAAPSQTETRLIKKGDVPAGARRRK